MLDKRHKKKRERNREKREKDRDGEIERGRYVNSRYTDRNTHSQSVYQSHSISEEVSQAEK